MYQQWEARVVQVDVVFLYEGINPGQYDDQSYLQLQLSRPMPSVIVENGEA